MSNFNILHKNHNRFFIALLFISIMACTNTNTHQEFVPPKNIPKEAQDILREINKVQYTNFDLLIEQVNALEDVDDKYAKIYADYYRLKANFLKEFSDSSLTKLNSIYPELKKYKRHKLMAEIDINTISFYQGINSYSKANNHVRNSLEYIFEPDMLLECEVIMYTLLSVGMESSLVENKEDILETLKEIKSSQWSSYHSRMFRSLADAHYLLGENEEAKSVMLKCIENNKKSNSNYDLQKSYVTMARIEGRLSKDYRTFIEYQEKSIAAANKYGAQNTNINYRRIGHKYVEKKLFEKAYNSYNKAIEVNTKNLEGLGYDYLYLAWAYFLMDKKNNFDKAIQLLDKAMTYAEPGSLNHKMILERKIWVFRYSMMPVKANMYTAELRGLREELNIDEREYIDTKTLFALNTKKHRLAKLRIENEKQEVKLEKQRLLNSALAIFTAMFFIVSYLFYRNRKNLTIIKNLNQKIQNSLIEIENNNNVLKLKNTAITNLLTLNERTLFTKVLKISTYKDAIDKLANTLSDLINKDEVIKPNQLFSTERALKSLINEEEIWIDFKVQFEKTRPGFFKKLYEMAPDLSVNNLKHCAYVISNLRSKEVANLINVSPRTVESIRYRIKRKLNLEKETSLYEFLHSL